MADAFHLPDGDSAFQDEFPGRSRLPDDDEFDDGTEIVKDDDFFDLQFSDGDDTPDGTTIEDSVTCE